MSYRQEFVGRYVLLARPVYHNLTEETFQFLVSKTKTFCDNVYTQIHLAFA